MVNFNSLKEKKKVLIIIGIFFFTVMNSYAQSHSKVDLTLGYNTIFEKQNPLKIGNSTFTPLSGNTVLSFQLSKTYFSTTEARTRFKLKHGISGYFRPFEFGIPVLSYMHTYQMDILKKAPDSFTLGMDANFQFGKWLIKKRPSDRYTTVFFSLLGHLDLTSILKDFV